MAFDPYGYQRENEERPPDTSVATHVVGGVSTVFWLGSAIAWCGCCSGALIWQPPDDTDTWIETVGVWHILMAPAWPLAAIGLWTVGLHALAKRWWTSVGPNVIAGAFSGSLLWGIVLIGWALFAVISEGG